MIDAVVGFVALLRRRGIGVGSDRAVLAARALNLVDLGDRDATRRALELTLLLHGTDRELFDELFEAWFAGSPFVVEETQISAPVTGDEDEDVAGDPLVELTATTVADAYVDDPAEQVAVSADDGAERRRGSGDPASSSEAEVVARFDQADAIGDFDDAATAQAADRSDETFGDDVVITLDEGQDSGPDDVAALRALLDETHRDRHALLDPPEPRTFTMRPNSVLANPFDREEQRTLDAAVRAMWPQLIGAPAWRRRPAPTGQLDLRRTLRNSVTFGGVPIVVRHRAPATNRPDLLVLVDTSVSMRPSVRLMLHLAHALRRRPGRVRVLGFVDECVDVTDVVRHADLATALGGLLDDAPGGPLDPARPSDYGGAFSSLWHRYARLLRSSTTVLVLGDGRSNGRDPGLAHLEDLRSRCRRSVWCTPEPEGAWSFGNGEMAAYASRVDTAITVRSLADLADAIHRGAFAPPRNFGGC